ncbi:9604_t:CDS:2, partial [Gigaspora rosea]
GNHLLGSGEVIPTGVTHPTLVTLEKNSAGLKNNGFGAPVCPYK